MHENALLQDLRRQLTEVARREGARRVSEVRIWLGALSHVTEPRLQEAWGGLVEGTPAQGARLQVEVSKDLSHPHAQSVVLAWVVVPDEEAA